MALTVTSQKEMSLPSLFFQVIAYQTEAPVAMEDHAVVSKIMAECQHHRLEPLFHSLLKQSSHWQDWPEAFREHLDRQSKLELLVENFRKEETEKVIEALASQGVEILIFKGSQLAYSHYPEGYLRPREDTDIFIRKEDVLKINKTMQALDFQAPPVQSGDFVSHQFIFSKEITSGIEITFDFHTKLFNRAGFADLFSFEELQEEKQEITALGSYAYGFSEKHAFLVACLHRALHHYDDSQLLWLYDLHLLLDGKKDAWVKSVIKIIEEKKISLKFFDCLLDLKNNFGTQVPKAFIQKVGFEKKGSRNKKEEIYFNPNVRLIDILLSDVRSLPSWRGKLKLIREHAFPSREYMLKKYQCKKETWLAFLYARGLFGGIPRLFSKMKSAG